MATNILDKVSSVGAIIAGSARAVLFSVSESDPIGESRSSEKMFRVRQAARSGSEVACVRHADGEPCAFISWPKDDLDAQYKLLGNLHVKFSHTTPMPEAESIPSFSMWNIRQLIAKHPSVVRWDEEVPSRRTLLLPGF